MPSPFKSSEACSTTRYRLKLRTRGEIVARIREKHRPRRRRCSPTDIISRRVIALHALGLTGRLGTTKMDKINAALKEMDVTTKIRVYKKFKALDADGSGNLDLAEFTKGFDTVGLTDAEMKAAFDSLDKDKNGTLKKREFMDILLPSMSEARTAKLKEVFQSADKTGDGLISTADLSRAFAANDPEVKAGTKTQEAVQNEFLNTFEPEGEGRDGKVTFEEFEKYYTPVSQRYASDDDFVNMVKGSWGQL